MWGGRSNEAVTPAWHGDRRMLAIVCALMIAQIGVASAAAAVQWERNLHPEILDLKFPYNDAFDPIVATHPTNPDRIAVSYHYQPPSGSHCGIIPGLRLSADGGATWHEAGRRPWAGSGRYPNWHATIAWGPGPTPGSGRLYWADTTVSSCQFADHRLSVAYSDDLGQSWSALFVYNAVPATSAGGYPDITVDRDPASPNYGVVYAPSIGSPHRRQSRASGSSHLRTGRTGSGTRSHRSRQSTATRSAIASGIG